MKKQPTPKLIPPPSVPEPESLTGILLPYQRKWIADKSPIKVCEKSRRIGITWAEACDSVLTAADRNGADVFYLGYNYEMSKPGFMKDVKHWAERIAHEALKAKEEIWEKGGEGKSEIMAYSVTFASGHSVSAVTSDPRSLRSKGRPGEVAVIDEAALHDDMPGVLKAAVAFTMLGGSVHIISTHKGIDNPFNELVDEVRAGKKPYSLHRVTIDNALNQGFFHHVIAERVVNQITQKLYTHEEQSVWRKERFDEYGDNADEELLVIPGAGEGGPYLPTALIESRMSSEIPILRWNCKASLDRGNAALYMDAADWIRDQLMPALNTRIHPNLMSCFGEDFGRSGDLTVIWPMQITEDVKRRTPFVIELRNVPFKQQAQILFAMVDKLPRFIGGAMDARGNGQYLAEEAALRYGVYDPKEGKHGGIEQVMLSIDWYRDNMPRYKAAFENGSIELPRNDGILADHRALRMEKGVARVPEDRIRDALGGQRHGDSAIAGALALYASYSSRPEYSYRTPAEVAPFMGYGERAKELEEDMRGGGQWNTGRLRFGRGTW